ncbi:MAG: hypothetical protein HOO96_27540 [Polyangiaceae bacterium]|jgi:uncharacterized tellurite resistance protein B-like protein|nr:hypothetical protein [Polyangiaceae bacterium]
MMDLEERHKVCELIETVIGADGVIAESEREFLRKIVQKFGLPERAATTAHGDTDFGRATTTLRALPEDARPRVMALLVEAAVVDGYVDSQERVLLLASAAALGIEATALEERITWRLKSMVPPAL